MCYEPLLTIVDPKVVRAPPPLSPPPPPPPKRPAPARVRHVAGTTYKNSIKVQDNTPGPLPKLSPPKPKPRAPYTAASKPVRQKTPVSTQQAPQSSKAQSLPKSSQAEVEQPQSAPSAPAKPAITTATLPANYRGGALPYIPGSCTVCTLFPPFPLFLFRLKLTTK